jgi:hypothetical protein
MDRLEMDPVPEDQREVSRQLAAAFRTQTAEMEYAGRVPTLRRTQPWRMALPAAAVMGVAATVAVVATQAGGPTGSSVAGPAKPSVTREASPDLETERIDLVSAALVYEPASRPGGDRCSKGREQARPGCLLQVREMRIRLGGIEMPEDATTVEIVGAERAWIAPLGGGKELGLYVELPGGDQPATAVLVSPGATLEQLIRLADSADLRVAAQ